MAQLKSSEVTSSAVEIPMPRRSFSIEFVVGIFTMVGVAAAGYLAVGLGDLRIFGSNRYKIFAEFDNVSGLETGASVEIAGVPVGEVTNIQLKDPMAIVTLSLDNGVKIKDDDIAAIRTKGIIGDRYVKVSRGASDVFIKEAGIITETESVVDIEDIIGKIVHSISGEKDDEDGDKTKDKK